MKITQINLKNPDDRFIYSERLKEFEGQFTYPLGTQTFTLVHGLKPDYFSFFEQLGQVHYLVMEEANFIIGAVCCVLRNIGGKKVWYLCDFKIVREHRGKGLHRALMAQFLFRYYWKSSRMMCVNMSAVQGNKLYLHSQDIFKRFCLDVEPRFLSQCNKSQLSEYEKCQGDFWSHHYITSNQNKKDIALASGLMPLYHIVRNERYLSGTAKFNLSYLPEDSVFMYLAHEPLGLFEGESEISYIHKGCPGIYLSSAEI